MAITPNQDLLSLIANKEGQWRFSRVQGWLEKEPHEDIRSATALLRQRDILRLLWPVSRSET